MSAKLKLMLGDLSSSYCHMKLNTLQKLNKMETEIYVLGSYSINLLANKMKGSSTAC